MSYASLLLIFLIVTGVNIQELEAFIGIDRDPTALEIARGKLAVLLGSASCQLFRGNFR